MFDNNDIINFGLDFNVDIPEEDDDQFKPVPKRDYIPEWEEEVKRYLIISGDLPQNKILYHHNTIPRDLSPKELEIWQREEIRRCIEGHDGMCGKMYFFFNYCWIQGQKKKERPHFRVIHNTWFNYVEACQKSNGWGIICVKRRRVGASWLEAADCVHDCLFNTHFNIGMNSKTERDSFILFNKVKFIYENLPSFLRVPVGINKQSELDFSYFIKDENGTQIKKGNWSNIKAVAPTDNAYEGMLLAKWICDEAGKIRNLATLWQYTEDCLMEQTRRTGIPILFGTAGDIGAEGKDLEYMWRNAHLYKLKQFFFAGWMGLTADNDPYGNDDKEEGIRWIVYERHRREKLRTEEYNTFIQKYPLTVPEAFTVTTDAGVGNIIKIKAQQQNLREKSAFQVKGWFKFRNDSTVDFVPDARGHCIIYEHPKQGVDSLYIGGADPADHNDTFKEASDLSMYIMKRQEGSDPPRIVFEYTDRPADVTEYYEQAMMALIYYNKAKVLIERNRYGMINFFEKSAYKYLIARTPKSVIKVVGGREMTFGLMMTPATKKYLKDLLAKYIEDYYEFIPSWELLDEFLYFGARNTDRAMAFGVLLVYLEDYDHPITDAIQANIRAPHFKYIKQAGAIKRINLNGTGFAKPIQNTTLTPNSRRFNGK